MYRYSNRLVPVAALGVHGKGLCLQRLQVERHGTL